MILGRNRVPYGGPPQANPNFRPAMPHTRFLTHMDPFANVNRRTAAYGPFHPATMPMPIGPAPSIPAPPPTPMTPAAAASPIGPSGVAGFGFGSTGGTKSHFHATPYTVMRSGMFPGISPSARHIRRGVHDVNRWIHQSTPFQTAPLPPPPPPPMPAPAPGGVKGLMGALFGYSHHHRARRHHWWQLTPPSTEEQAVASTGCETYPPRADGIRVTVCNGRVVKYEDAQGNVNTPDAGSGVEYGSGGMAGFGFPGFRRFVHTASWLTPPGAAYNLYSGRHRHHRRHRHPTYQPQPYTPPPASVPQFGW